MILQNVKMASLKAKLLEDWQIYVFFGTTDLIGKDNIHLEFLKNVFKIKKEQIS